ncbi:MAG TPA: hypothetical protein VGJ87_10185, partial [Roseiflexaceae bacterium]
MADPVDIAKALEDHTRIEDALRLAAVSAWRKYVCRGLSMPVWKDGQLAWIAPDELQRLIDEHDGEERARPRGSQHRPGWSG